MNLSLFSLLFVVVSLELETAWSAVIKNEIQINEDDLNFSKSSVTKTAENTEENVTLSESSSPKDKAEEIYGKLTGIANRLKKETCKCVSLFDECGVEMLEESVIKVRGRACLSNQRYCCQKEEFKMKPETESNLKKLFKSSNLGDELPNEGNYTEEKFETNSESSTPEEGGKDIQKDESSNSDNASLDFQKDLTTKTPKLNATTKEVAEGIEGDKYIRPETLGAVLRLLTEGFKFLSNFF